MRLVDMREQVVDVPPQEVITSDNVVVSVDAVIYYEPTDPQRLLYNVANFILAVTKLAQTNLRNVIGDLSLDEALTSRDKLNLELRQILDDATDKWGVRVVRVEIQRIDPPPDVMSAMHEQMKAERTRRAQVTTRRRLPRGLDHEGRGREAGRDPRPPRASSSSQVLEAEGQAQAVRTLAEAERYRSETIAAGEANAIRRVFRRIHDGDPTNDLIAVKYLETLPGVADGQATKIYLPMDSGGMSGALAGVAELFKGAGEDPDGPRRRADRARVAGGRGAGAATSPGAIRRARATAPAAGTRGRRRSRSGDAASGGVSRCGPHGPDPRANTSELGGGRRRRGERAELAGRVVLVLHHPTAHLGEERAALLGARRDQLVGGPEPGGAAGSVQVAVVATDGEHVETRLDVELQLGEAAPSAAEPAATGTCVTTTSASPRASFTIGWKS